MTRAQGDGEPVPPPTHDELVVMYFSDVTPVTELQGRIMRTYAQVFEKTFLLEEEQFSSEELRKLITDAHSVFELFSHDLHSNDSISRIVRPILAEFYLHPVPNVCQASASSSRSLIR